MIVLSLEAERIMSGFSDDVANAVTQPLWPITHKLDEIRRVFAAYRGASLLKRGYLPCCVKGGEEAVDAREISMRGS